MTTSKCPNCQCVLNIHGNAAYRCPDCNCQFKVSNNKTILLKHVSKPSQYLVIGVGVFIMFIIISLSGNGASIQTDNATNQKLEKQQDEKSDTKLALEKAQKEKDALEEQIALAHKITEDYPEEIDGVTTDVKGTQDAKVRIVGDPESKTYDVLQVVDGDTIKVSELGTLRLIGIDTPETVDPRKPVQCFGQEATNKAKSLLEGKKVKLEFDTSQGRLDKYGRTLAYVHRDDGLFFNLEMIKQGFAHEYTYSTPYKYQTEFKKAQSEAQEAKRGLWGTSCECEKGKEVSRSCTACNQSTVTKSNWDCSTYTEKVSSSSCSSKCSTVVPTPAPKPSPSYTCNCSKTCTQISSCAEAQYQLKTCGCSARDGDKDGIACDGAPLNCQ